MMKTTTLLFGILFLPGAVLSSATMASSQMGTEHEAVGAVMRDAAVMPTPATETVRGIVDSIDQRSDTIKLRLSPETIQQFRVQDGLVFDIVRFGDRIEVAVQDIEGAKTIVGLRRSSSPPCHQPATCGF